MAQAYQAHGDQQCARWVDFDENLRALHAVIRAKPDDAADEFGVPFALATLPIFGLGQAILAVDDVERRSNVFWFMAIYVFSGLALLLTTCFLSLRRYLRQRNVEMPVKMTASTFSDKTQ